MNNVENAWIGLRRCHRESADETWVRVFFSAVEFLILNDCSGQLSTLFLTDKEKKAIGVETMYVENRFCDFLFKTRIATSFGEFSWR